MIKGENNMNPIFVFLVLLATILLWFLLAFLFKPVGKIVSRLVGDVKEAMEIDSNKEEKE